MKKLIIFIIILSFCCLTGSVIVAANEKNEASMIFKSGTNLNDFLSKLKKKKSTKDQIYAMGKFTEPLAKNIKGLKITDKYAINNFIVYGTPSTYNLSAKSRYDLISQYKVKYKKLPTTEADWIKLLELASAKKTLDDSLSSNLLLDIRTAKNNYTTGESLVGSSYFLKYSGKSFKGLILYGEGREGLIKTTYGATRGTIKTGDFDHPETIPGMKANIYSVKPDGTPNALECDGIYKYTIAVYDCAMVDKALGTSDCGQGGWPPTIESKDIFSQLKPLKITTKNITVACANGSTNCCDNSNFKCSRDDECHKGYLCNNGKCLKNN